MDLGAFRENVNSFLPTQMVDQRVARVRPSVRPFVRPPEDRFAPFIHACAARPSASARPAAIIRNAE